MVGVLVFVNIEGALTVAGKVPEGPAELSGLCESESEYILDICCWSVFSELFDILCAVHYTERMMLTYFVSLQKKYTSW